MRCSWISPSTGPLDPHRLREAVQTVVTRHPHLAARFCEQFDEPVQVIPADPVMPWQYIELDASGADVDEQVRACVRRRARSGVRSGRPAGFSGGVDPHRSRSAPVRADQSPHRARWLVDCRSCWGRSSPAITASGCPRPRRTAGLSRWLAERDLEAARTAWGEVLAGFDTPTLVRPPTLVELGPRGVESFSVPEDTTRALTELARSCHTTVNIVLQAAFAQLLMLVDRPPGCGVWHRSLGQADRAGRCGLDGGADDQHRAGARNHHRGHHHRRPARSTAKRPQPHPGPPAPGASRDPPRHRPRPAVRHAVRV